MCESAAKVSNQLPATTVSDRRQTGTSLHEHAPPPRCSMHLAGHSTSD